MLRFWAFDNNTASVRPIAPDNNSIEPPLGLSTLAVAVSVKFARSPVSSPMSLKSLRMIGGNGGGVGGGRLVFTTGSVASVVKASNKNEAAKHSHERRGAEVWSSAFRRFGPEMLRDEKDPSP